MTPPQPRRGGDGRKPAGGRGGRGGPAGHGGPTNRRVAGPAKRPGSGPKPRSAPAPRPNDQDVHDPDGVRLQKLLAAAGVGSRRKCELLITDGRVQVDGIVVTELGVRIDPDRQVVHVDGERVQLGTPRVHLAFNKPVGVVTTMDDELGRPSIGDYVAMRKERLFHVGRLDADTDGLLLLTNDGELAQRLQHPSYGVLKTYVAQIPGPVPKDLGRTLREGIELDDGPVAVHSFKVLDSAPGKALVEVVIHEGRKHIVRRLLEAVGHPVVTLTRTQVGPIHLGDTKAGRYRALSAPEVAALYKAAGL